VTRDEHLKAVYVVGTAMRGKTAGLLMLCSGPECGGAEMFAAGLTADDVAAAADAHMGQANDVRASSEGQTP
jgi:hypothetical protein